MISEEIVNALKRVGVNLFVTLPCEKARPLFNRVSENFRHIALASEEEGVGICAGAFLAGSKPAMLVQSSGVGRIINAVCSLTKVYELPLLIFVSWRGVYKEKIPAQIPLGKRLPQILTALDIDYSVVEASKDVRVVSDAAADVYSNNTVHAVLLNPRIWENEKVGVVKSEVKSRTKTERALPQREDFNPVLTRFEILKVIVPYLDGKIVVCNLGIPCKELYQVKHQKSNFYMLGSMGQASPIGLGIASFTQKDVVVIDGDGSLLMNLGALSTIASTGPENLTVLAIDNGVHGTTGNQPTATSEGADLELIARASGFHKTYKAASKAQILQTLRKLNDGPNFVHILARPGNAEVPNVPLAPVEIKWNVMEAIKA